MRSPTAQYVAARQAIYGTAESAPTNAKVRSLEARIQELQLALFDVEEKLAELTGLSDQVATLQNALADHLVQPA